jgi:hypothetical protein
MAEVRRKAQAGISENLDLFPFCEQAHREDGRVRRTGFGPLVSARCGLKCRINRWTLTGHCGLDDWGQPLLILYDLWGENASIFLIDCASGASHAVFAIDHR